MPITLDAGVAKGAGRRSRVTVDACVAVNEPRAQDVGR